MTRREFMAKLAALLTALPPQERVDALRYYEEYFDAAGPEAEQTTTAELGTPETVAAKILEGAGVTPPRKLPKAMRCAGWVLLAAGLVLAAILALNATSFNPLATSAESAPATSAADGGEWNNAYGSLPAASISKIVIKMNTGKLVVKSDGKNKEVEVNAGTPQPENFSTEYTGAYLITDTTKANSADDGPVVTVTIPTGVVLPIEISMELGSVDVSGLVADSLDVSITTGALTARTLEARTLTADCTLGAIEVDKLIGVQSVKADNACGDITLKLAAPAEEYAFRGICHFGSINYNGEVTSGQLLSHGYNETAAKKLELNCTQGTMTVAFEG